MIHNSPYFASLEKCPAEVTLSTVFRKLRGIVEPAGPGTHTLSRGASSRPIAMGGWRYTSVCQLPDPLR
ncbi:hypothetical protein IIY66_00485 [Candidatus Saccharibacteria bacterium]|nr:hypothetical protein [Candidatus Saccharibacteria bacterium]